MTMNMSVMCHSLESSFTYHPLLCPGEVSIFTHLADKATETRSSHAVCPRNSQRETPVQTPSSQSQILPLE